MKLKFAVVLAIALCIALSASAQSQSDYLDIYIVKIKPEKRADFDQIARKIADANRNNKGDRWLAAEAV